MSVNFSEIMYKNFGKCIKMENQKLELIITVDVGPRIISCNLKGKENLFGEDIERAVFRDDDDLHSFFETTENWNIYGGHRLWTSPESWPHSYTPDNSPVKYEIKNNKIVLMPESRIKVGEEHIISVEMQKNEAFVKIQHTVKNISSKPQKLSLWPMTVMSKGGVQVFPQSDKATGLLSNRRMVFWPYSSVSDQRFFMDDKYMTLSQDPSDKNAFKIGINNEMGWTAYLNSHQLFIKRFKFDDNAAYPDFEVNFETYTNSHIMEIESLSPLTEISPDGVLSFDEAWEVIPCNETFNPKDSKSIETFVGKYIS